MDYPHLVTPQKIRLSRDVELVPQLGHRSAILCIDYEPDSSLLAALDASSTVQVWNMVQAEVLQILPLPVPGCDKIQWLDSNVVAVRQPPEEADDPPVWWIRTLTAGERWRPSELPEDDAERWHLEPSPKGKTLGVVPPGGERVTLKKAPVTELTAIDPLGRFVLVAQDKEILLYDSSTGECKQTFDDHDAPVAGLGLTSKGDLMVSCSVTGELCIADPMREEALRPLFALPDGATTLRIAPNDKVVAVGDELGHVTLIGMQSGRRLQRTPRRIPGFEWEALLTEGVGYFGARRESFGGYIDGSREIIPMRPLPGTATGVAPSLDFPRVVVCLEDGRVVELELGEETVETLGTAPFPLEHLSLSDYGVLGTGSGGVFFHDGENARTWKAEELTRTTAVAVDRDSEVAAFALPKFVAIYSPKGKKLKVVAVPDAVAVGFTRYRDRKTLAMVDRSGVLWRWEQQKDRLTRVGVLECDELATIGEILSLAVDQDGALRLLSRGDHAHRHLLMIDLATAKASLLAGTIVHGHQIVAVYDEDGTWLRQDEQRSVRMVRNLIAYAPREWLRLPHPGQG